MYLLGITPVLGFFTACPLSYPIHTVAAFMPYLQKQHHNLFHLAPLVHIIILPMNVNDILKPTRREQS